MYHFKVHMSDELRTETKICAAMTNKSMEEFVKMAVWDAVWRIRNPNESNKLPLEKKEEN